MPAQACRPNETQIAWNSQGPKGDPGKAGGASVVAYPWPQSSTWLTSYCGTEWLTLGGLPAPDCGSNPVVIPAPITGIDAYAVFPIDAAQYPAGAKISLRYLVTRADQGTTACVRLFDAVGLKTIAGSQTCTGDRGWHATPPVPIGSLTLLTVQVQQPDAAFSTEDGYWPEAPVQYGGNFLEVSW